MALLVGAFLSIDRGRALNYDISLGAIYLGGGQCRFRVWAPFVNKVEVHVLSPVEQIATMTKDPQGYHQAVLSNLEPGITYRYRLDDEKERPDPASRCQPDGVHGPSQVVKKGFSWSETDWPGLPMKDYVLYELHVGAFTRDGTFSAIVSHLDELRDLGITAVELMPVAQFPGDRNWGYDGVYPFAVQNSYGGPDGLRHLVDACHTRGLAVVLDVVYNHLGPEGNYLADFGPYFTDTYKTPWGPAINFDGPYSDEVRRFFIENALYWVTDFRIDALRIDAVHGIFDSSAEPFLEELALTVRDHRERLNRRIYLIAESDLNDSRLLRSRALGGYGLDAQWNDDFHHALHTLLTSERTGYYQDFGLCRDLTKAFRSGFVYSGEYSGYRKRRHGNDSSAIPAHRMVVFSQNHDQVGNRMLGDRLSSMVSLEGLKLAAGVVILSPFLPLLFMGEEYGETSPFPYFVSHSDPYLIEATRQGRRQEFASFNWAGEPQDPQAESTFLSAKLNRDVLSERKSRILLNFYRKLLSLRKILSEDAGLTWKTGDSVVFERQKVIFLLMESSGWRGSGIFHFGDGPDTVTIPFPAGTWTKRIDSAEAAWDGPGSSISEAVTSEGEVTLTLAPYSFALFT
jgi:maltooligosyltrehalose trehalohydrolase